MPIETIIIEFQSNTDGLVQGENKVADSLKKVNTELSKQQQELGREEATMSKLTSSLGRLTGESKKSVEQLLKLSGKEVVAGFDKLGLSVDDYVDSLKEAEKETGTFGKTTQDAGKKTQKAAQELKSMREELIRMERQGKANTKEFKDLQAEAGNLADTIADVGEGIKRVGSDTGVFDGLISATQGLAGGFAVVQGASALFGDENKELQETLLRVNAAMAVLQGLQQVQTVLQKDSAAMVLLTDIRMKALAASQALYTAVVGTSTGALKIFRIALAATGVGALILGIIALVQNFDKVKDAISSVLPNFGKFADTVKGVIQNITDFVGITSKAEREVDALTAATGRLNATIDGQIKILEAQDGKDEEIYQLRLKRIEGEELAINAKYRRGIKLSEDENKRLDEIGIERQVLEIENNKRIEDERKAAREKRLAAEKEAEAKYKKQLQDFYNDQIALFKIQQREVADNSVRFKELEAAIIGARLQLDLLEKEGHEAELAMKEAASATAALFVNIRPNTAGAVKADLDISTQFAEQAAKDQIAIDQTALDAKHKYIDELQKAEFAAIEETDKKKKEKSDLDKQRDKDRVDFALQTASQITSIFAEAFKQQTENEIRKVEGQRKRVQDLREVGAISEKEAEKRLKQLDEKQRQIQVKSAQRDKQIAIFQAIISTAAAVAKALPVIPLAIAAGALGAAQIALIAARPIPKFKGGKKNSYEGLGIVGEAGAELIERNGRMEVARKEQLVWLNKNDKVYTPKETQSMLMDAPPSTVIGKSKTDRIDYDRMGKSIAKHLPQHNISFDKDGFQYAVKQGQDFIKYLDKRRKF